MIVRISAAGALVLDADDCTRLHLESDLDPGDLGTALTTTDSGELAADGAVWLDLGVLRSRAQLLTDDPDWPQRWADMVTYAERSGWLSDDGLAVRVHVEPATS